MFLLLRRSTHLSAGNSVGLPRKYLKGIAEQKERQDTFLGSLAGKASWGIVRLKVAFDCHYPNQLLHTGILLMDMAFLSN